MRWGAALALAIAGGQAWATAAPASEAQVRQLMDVVGVGKMLAQMNSQAITTLQQSMPCVSPDFWQNYMDANQTQLFIGRLVPVYQHHFTADELDGLLKFYRSPLGQKVINEMPTTMAEANQAGQQWSHERSDQMIAELKQMGSLDANGRCPAKIAAAPVAGAAALAGVAAHQADEADAEETPAKATSKAPAKSKTTAHKAPAKTTAKKPATASKTPAKADSKPAAKTEAKSDTKSDAKPDAKAAPAKAPAPASPSASPSGGQ
ncbi:DUF2059 domain-containing protein [Dyella solisilvae]|uniref:DUF2059 domain-containing protein n=1 Tax=Dyella solisilvae TaxID=1920168 RepID=UPI002D76CDA4|nr:DUF2059 domain-containing protein [Dyella solisilvae]